VFFRGNWGLSLPHENVGRDRPRALLKAAALLLSGHHAQAPGAFLDHSRTLPQGDGSAGASVRRRRGRCLDVGLTNFRRPMELAEGNVVQATAGPASPRWANDKRDFGAVESEGG
jgi:hypothetical protein